LPSERPASATLHLQLSRRPRHEGIADLPPLRQQTQQWFADYHAHLNLLVDAARTIECPNG
jgi:hypothetical protein